jgi:hypothetical protein
MSDLDELRHPPPVYVDLPMLGGPVEEDCEPFRTHESPLEEGAELLELLSEDASPEPGLWSIPQHWGTRESWVTRFLRKLAGGD